MQFQRQSSAATASNNKGGQDEKDKDEDGK
jgi:hypothetical protein